MPSWPARRRARGPGLAPYAFVFPFIASFVLFTAFAVVASLVFSFTDWEGYGPLTFTGIDNYLAMLSDKTLRRAFGHTILIWLLTVPLLSFGSLVMAWFVESKYVRPLRAFFRTALFLPVLPSLAVVAIIFLLMMDPDFGLIGQAFKLVGLKPVNIYLNTVAAIPLISFIIVWKAFGYMIVIQLAGLQTFPSQVREAAEIDGINNWNYFWFVLVPLSKPIIAFVGVLCTIGVFNTFEESYLLYSTVGGPEQSGLVMGTYLYREGIIDFHIGYASAVSYVLAIIMFIAAALQLRWSRDD